MKSFWFLMMMFYSISSADYAGQLLAQDVKEQADVKSRLAYSIIFPPREIVRDNSINSPISAYMALASLQMASAGETEKEFAKATGFSEPETEMDKRKSQVESEISVWNTEVSNYEKANGPFAQKIEFLTKNVMLVTQGVMIKEDFKKRFTENLKGQIFTMSNKENERARQISDALRFQKPKMNDNGIQEALKTADLAAVIIASTFIKAPWSKPFKKSDTMVETFNGEAGKQRVPMMNATLEAAVFDNPNFEAISIDVAKTFDFVVFLPKEATGLAKLRELINETLIDSIVKVKPIAVKLSLPRFKVTKTSDLISTFKGNGITAAFDGKQSDFSRLTNSQVVIGAVFQNSEFSVNEDGLCGSSQTVAQFVFGSEPSSIRNLAINRPFSFVLRSKESKELLFGGSVCRIEAE